MRQNEWYAWTNERREGEAHAQGFVTKSMELLNGKHTLEHGIIMCYGPWVLVYQGYLGRTKRCTNAVKQNTRRGFEKQYYT